MADYFRPSNTFGYLPGAPTIPDRRRRPIYGGGWPSPIEVEQDPFLQLLQDAFADEQTTAPGFALGYRGVGSPVGQDPFLQAVRAAFGQPSVLPGAPTIPDRRRPPIYPQPPPPAIPEEDENRGPGDKRYEDENRGPMHRVGLPPVTWPQPMPDRIPPKWGPVGRGPLPPTIPEPYPQPMPDRIRPTYPQPMPDELLEALLEVLASQDTAGGILPGAPVIMPRNGPAGFLRRLLGGAGF